MHPFRRPPFSLQIWQVPPSLLPEVVALTGSLPEATLGSAMQRAVESAQPLQLTELKPEDRDEIVRKAVETVVAEAVHW